MSQPQTTPGRVVPYAAVATDASVRAALDAVFFSSSHTKTFADDAARLAFRERWLGRYLQHFPDCCFVAIDVDGQAVGYICGSLQDPARDPRFADQPHFAHFADLTPAFPAQLHVNLAQAARGRGIGRLLIEALAAHASAAGAAGIHAISSRGARNLGFYAANGFTEAGSASIGDKELVFLGRSLR
ncbi:MAG: GNAT family N-acetyltransferase [Hyphomicrobiaceae bacterium]|nr:GNAT family N-acetyltransferase [Hyphomicrobiaceae bacterium]